MIVLLRNQKGRERHKLFFYICSRKCRKIYQSCIIEHKYFLPCLYVGRHLNVGNKILTRTQFLHQTKQFIHIRHKSKLVHSNIVTPPLFAVWTNNESRFTYLLFNLMDLKHSRLHCPHNYSNLKLQISYR